MFSTLMFSMDISIKYSAVGEFMANTVTASTLLTNSFKTIYDILTNGTNGVSDPASRSLARTKWVMPSFPDEYGSDFPDYPIITIEADLNYNTDVLAKGARDVLITFSISIFAKKAQYLDSVCDNIQSILNTYQSTSETNKIFHPTMTGTTTVTHFRDKDKIHTRTMYITYRWRG